ncbi:hypothetical protein GCM10020001_083570 [Nonomuraea salmonea]
MRTKPSALSTVGSPAYAPIMVCRTNPSSGWVTTRWASNLRILARSWRASHTSAMRSSSSSTGLGARCSGSGAGGGAGGVCPVNVVCAARHLALTRSGVPSSGSHVRSPSGPISITWCRPARGAATRPSAAVPVPPWKSRLSRRPSSRSYVAASRSSAGG